MKEYSHRYQNILFFCFVLGIVLVSIPSSVKEADCQTVQDSMMQRQEEARTLEREIGVLETQMSRAKKDWVTVSERLAGLEENILNCHMEIEKIGTEIEKSKGAINGLVRDLYVGGPMSDLDLLLASKDISDFITNFDHVARVVTSESRAFKGLREKQNRLERYEVRLSAYKSEQARLARSADPNVIEASIEEKRSKLADINSEIISLQLPVVVNHAPVDFSPTRVFSMPEENGFISTGQVLSGYSSWYGGEFNGRPTASGEIYDQYAFTCAHQTLPFGTWLRVTFRGRSVIVKVNDRGPFVKGRMLDLSRGSAEAIGLIGVQWVDCEILVPKKS
jgi:rare lipoprotein A (peptidoglycan hydrolase)